MNAPGSRTLRRTLGLWQVTLSGIGVILGAGVYALVGPAAGLAGNALWLAFLLAGVTAGLTAYSYARFGAIQPKNSPEFQYTSLVFGTRIGFVAGFLMLAADLLAAATVALSLIALAATANTVLLLLVSASRSVYGMASAGALTARLARIGKTGAPVAATLLVSGITGGLVLLGNVARVAAMTDAAVLVSFMLVNLSLPRLAYRGLTGGHAGKRMADLLLPGLALLMCGWFLLHTGWVSIAVAAGLTILGFFAAAKGK